MRPTSPLRGKVLEDHFKRFKLPQSAKFLAPYEEFYKRTAVEDLLKNTTSLYFGQQNQEVARLKLLKGEAKRPLPSLKHDSDRLSLVALPSTF